jgi:DNA-binding MarR family transcriptional regulator
MDDQQLDERLAPVMLDKHAGALSRSSAVRLWLRLLTCSTTVEKRLRRRFADQFDTTLPRFDVLAALDRFPDGVTMSRLSRILLVSGGNLTALVRQLQGQGHLVMERDHDDGRVWIVRSTDEGRTHFEALSVAHHKWIVEMFQGLGDADSRMLFDLLDNLKQSLADAGEPVRAA